MSGRRSILLILTGWLLGVAAGRPAEDHPITSSGDLQYYLDYAFFKHSREKQVYCEFYLMFYADQFHLVSKNNTAWAVAKIEVEIQNDFMGVRNRKWTTEAQLSSDSINRKGIAIYDQWTDELSSGRYELNLMVSDPNGTARGSVNLSLDVPAMNSGQLVTSSLEFVSRIESNKKTGRFTKGNRSVMPNPSRRYGLLNPMLTFYYEVYNIQSAAGDSLELKYTITDAAGKVVKNYPEMKFKNPGTSASVIHAFDVSSLGSGVYDLVIGVKDPVAGTSTGLRRSFEVIQLDFASAKPVLVDDQLNVMDHVLQYLISPQEYNLFASLNSTAKTNFIIQFWNDKDPSPGTPKNEFLEEIQQRYRYANKNFGWGVEEGWGTDRGRILIKYGMPDEIDRHQAESETVPYETWIYHQQKIYEFVFADLRANGRYVLLHSDKEGEVRNDNWLEQIKRM